MSRPVFDLTSSPVPAIPETLAELHRDHAVGTELDVALPTALTAQDRAWLLEGGGFESVDGGTGAGTATVPVRRVRTLPDTVRSGLRLLVCGLNPSLHAADAGVGFVSPSNRFFKAAMAAGVVTADRDPWHALLVDRVGMTDLVKRATRKASEVRTVEYRAGLRRLDYLCGLVEPAAVCMVGLAGWRAAVDRRASAGPSERLLGGRPVYVMPSTSGLNASSSLPDLVAHLGQALRAGGAGHGSVD